MLVGIKLERLQSQEQAKVMVAKLWEPNIADVVDHAARGWDLHCFFGPFKLV